ISCNLYDNPELSKEDIVNLSNFIAEELNAEIKENIILSTLVKNTTKNLVSIIIDEPKKIKDIISDKKQLFINYFNTYQNKNYTSKITVFYSGEDQDYINWRREDSIDVYLNYSRIIEGFFLLGFDYRKEGNEWLRLAVNHD